REIVDDRLDGDGLGLHPPFLHRLDARVGSAGQHQQAEKSDLNGRRGGTADRDFDGGQGRRRAIHRASRELWGLSAVESASSAGSISGWTNRLRESTPLLRAAATTVATTP